MTLQKEKGSGKSGRLSSAQVHDDWAHRSIDRHAQCLSDAAECLAETVGGVALCSELTEHLDNTHQAVGVR